MQTNTVSRLGRAAGAGAIALAALFIYWPVRHGGWIWDDFTGIALDPTLRSPAGLRRIWLAPPGPDYFPLKSTIQWLEWHAWGGVTTGYHLVSVATHVLGALLLWRLFGRLGVRGAWLGGLVFAIHPLAVESVAWISEQKNTLSLPLLLLAADAYLTFDAAPRIRPYLQALLWFLAAMLCKSSVAMFPVVLLLYAWWRRGRIARSDLAASLPFFAISVVLGLVTVWFQAHYAIGSERIARGGAASRLAGAGLALAFYAWKCVFPVGLMPIYPRWSVDPPSLVQFWPWFAGGILAGWLWPGHNRRPGGSAWRRGALLGGGFFVVNLLPVLGFIPMSFARVGWVSDHLVYLPLLAPAGLAAAGAAAIRDKLSRGWCPFAGAAASLVLLALLLASRAYARVFRSEISLWTYATARNPASVVAHYDLANARFRAGQIAAAIPEYEAAIRLRPDFAPARLSYGDALLRLGRPSVAVEQYAAALRSNPSSFPAREKLGGVFLSEGRIEEAIAEYRPVVAARPDDARAQGDLAYALALDGRFEEAAARYATALRLDPASAEDWDQLGTVLAHMGRDAAARRDYERALQLRPDDPEAHNNLGLLLAREGHLAEAIGHFEAALRARPDFPAAKRNLALARLAQP